MNRSALILGLGIAVLSAPVAMALTAVWPNLEAAAIAFVIGYSLATLAGARAYRWLRRRELQANFHRLTEQLLREAAEAGR